LAEGYSCWEKSKFIKNDSKKILTLLIEISFAGFYKKSVCPKNQLSPNYKFS